MLGKKNAVATVAVKDIQAARRFYEDKLGLQSDGKDGGKETMNGNITYKTGGTDLLVYTSQFAGTNQATSATWGVGDDFDEIVKDLQSKGVTFEHYDNLPGLNRQGDVHQAEGLKLAWFKDPDGNIHHLISL
jgi:catechol 2,3-dioxygenase-like lactoylglutathione lyase family enzyme